MARDYRVRNVRRCLSDCHRYNLAATRGPALGPVSGSHSIDWNTLSSGLAATDTCRFP
jgi:hypothetical protein